MINNDQQKFAGGRFFLGVCWYVWTSFAFPPAHGDDWPNQMIRSTTKLFFCTATEVQVRGRLDAVRRQSCGRWLFKVKPEKSEDMKSMRTIWWTPKIFGSSLENIRIRIRQWVAVRSAFLKDCRNWTCLRFHLSKNQEPTGQMFWISAMLRKMFNRFPTT